jgi:hypothetical protein
MDKGRYIFPKERYVNYIDVSILLHFCFMNISFTYLYFFFIGCRCISILPSLMMESMLL